MTTERKEYWMCLIGPINPNKYKGNGADFPLRMAVQNEFINMFDECNEVCASGWGIDEERYEILRNLHILPTMDLKKMLKEHQKLKK